jgi:uncharacterized protein
MTPRIAEAALVTLLAGHNWMSNRMLPRWAYVPSGLVVSVAAVQLSRLAGATTEELGLERQRMGNGVRVGAIASSVAAAAVVTGVAIPATRRFYADERVLQPHGLAVAYEMAVRIPVGTALAEELMFRSALLGLSLHRGSWVASTAWSSTLFGLWHVLPTLTTLPDNAALTGVGDRVGRAGAVATSVAATAIAGAVFAELRRRSGSVVAPILLHATVNLAAFAAARWSRSAAQPIAGDDLIERKGRSILPASGAVVDDEVVRMLRDADQR